MARQKSLQGAEMVSLPILQILMFGILLAYVFILVDDIRTKLKMPVTAYANRHIDDK